MRYDRIARISVGKTNHNVCDLLDVARRQADHLGPVGMAAKRGQTNARFLRKGYLAFVFPDIATRSKFVRRVREFCHPAVDIGLYKRRHS